MGAGHSHSLHHHGHSVLHHMAPEAKVLGTVLLVVSFAVTPPSAGWAFAAHAVVLAALIAVSRVPVGFVLARATVVLPFILFALLLPFVGEGERTTVAGIGMSAEGLTAAGGIVGRSLLGVTTSILLAATTTEARILTGLDRLRVPRVLTMIAGFMLRYLRVLADELGRMRTAMTARGYDPRWLWQAKPIATSAGALFVRGYERGERVHGAMLARGYTGAMPAPSVATATARDWTFVVVAVALTATTSTIALVTS